MRLETYGAVEKDSGVRSQYPFTGEPIGGRVEAMRAAVFHEPHRVEAGDRPDASLREPTDAVVRVALACVCGKSLVRVGTV